MNEIKGVIVLANGFEDSEGITTIDVLRRAGIEMITATPNEDLIVNTSHKMKVFGEVNLRQVNSDMFDFLVIPGGAAVFTVLDKMPEISKLIKDFHNSGKLVAAICAAPHLVGKLGLFKGIKYTCFPGCDGLILEGKNTNNTVEVEKEFITGRSMYYSADFALAIVERFMGKDKAKAVRSSICGEKAKEKR